VAVAGSLRARSLVFRTSDLPIEGHLMKPKPTTPGPAQPRMPARENQPDLTPIPIDDGKTDPPLPIREQKGEGSVSGARDYQKSVKSYLAKADVEKDAHAAAPATTAEAKDLAAAEKVGRNRGPVMRKKYPYPS
jgi:hypothetical protein